MPIYEYTCKSCKRHFEELVRSMSSRESIPCPECGSTSTARTLSVFAVGSEGAKTQGADIPMCGRCGGAPGSCQT